MDSGKLDRGALDRVDVYASGRRRGRTPDEIVAADVPPTSFWRGWRLSLAAPPPEDD